jgi:hypothetical protein
VSQSDARAVAKAIGEDVELVPDSTVDWYDAIATSCVWPQPPAIFGRICVVWRGAPVEIKACQVSVSKGDADCDGKWLFKGRDDGQHDSLLEHDGVYVLAVHREADVYLGREVVGLIVIPAATIGDHLDGSWYDSQRREGMSPSYPGRSSSITTISSSEVIRLERLRQQFRRTTEILDLQRGDQTGVPLVAVRPAPGTFASGGCSS